MSRLPPNQIAKYCAALGLMGLLALPALAGLMGVRAEAIENRDLAKWPRVKLRDALEPKAIERVGAFLIDHLPLRGDVIQLRSWIFIKLWHDSPSGLVYLGEPPWLFFVETFINACAPGARPENIANRLGRLETILQESGRRLIVAIVPDKAAVYPEKLGASAPLARCAAARRRQLRKALRQEGMADFIDFWQIFHALRNRNPDPLLYLPNDTHWSPYGALQLTRRVIRHLNPDLWQGREIASSAGWEREGDLTRMMGWPSKLVVSDYRVERQDVSVVELPPEESRAGLRNIHRYRARSLDGKQVGFVPAERLLLIHDSFGLAANPMLLQFFNETNTAHWMTAGSGPALAAELRDADLVLLLVAERNVYQWIPRVFSDRAVLNTLPAVLAQHDRAVRNQ